MDDIQLEARTDEAKQELNHIGRLIIESYEVNNVGNQSYKLEKAIKLLESNNKLDSLFSLLNIDEKNRKTFAKKLGVADYKDFEAFLRVLKLV
ncbi:hypothetical protein SAMN06313486_1012 [Epsilonproteobacteria bacterium SCGC AD-308-P11]|nr:hypothetical protein SAMN06313486_1012 [Epsilonproteobacteria bacterium SCGC AD-308-P11]